jgi:hypothetical protein
MRIYLAVTLWGEEYRRYFLDFCLASLLGPGNLPALTEKASARLLIATNNDDWAALQAEPTFLAAKSFITMEHVPFDPSQSANPHMKMLVMSEAHRRLAWRMFEDRAQGIFIYPDMIAAEGLIARLQQLREQGFKLVMFMNVRFANEGLIGELKERGLVRRGEPIALSCIDLVRLTIRHMHSEMRRSCFDSNCQDYGCSSYFWEVVPGGNLLFHCGGWIPALMDYAAIAQHDDSTFAAWTLDGDYAAKNFADSDKVYFIYDTTELFLISFTPEAKVSYSLEPVWRYRIPLLRTSLKIIAAHRFLYRGGILNRLTKKQFRRPVRLSGGECAEWRWREVEDRAAAIIERISRGGNLADRVLYCSDRVLYCSWRLLRFGGTIAIRIGQIVSGDRVAKERVIKRLRQLSCKFFRKPFSDSQPRL